MCVKKISNGLGQGSLVKINAHYETIETISVLRIQLKLQFSEMHFFKEFIFIILVSPTHALSWLMVCLTCYFNFCQRPLAKDQGITLVVLFVLVRTSSSPFGSFPH